MVDEWYELVFKSEEPERSEHAMWSEPKARKSGEGAVSIEQELNRLRNHV